MKSGICITGMVILLTGTAWSMDFSMSAGGGGFIGGHFTRYTLRADGKVDDTSQTPPVKVDANITSEQSVDQLNMGGFLFFDAAWAELNIGILAGPYQYAESMYAENSGTVVFGKKDPETGTGRETMLSLSLLGKYPFELNRQLTVFPLLGLDYQIAIQEVRQVDGFKLYDRTQKRETDSNGGRYQLSAWNSLFIVVGGGLDFNFYSPFFLRTELLYSIRLQTPWEIDNLKKVKDMVAAPNPTLSGLSSGPTLKLCVGWRFYDRKG